MEGCPVILELHTSYRKGIMPRTCNICNRPADNGYVNEAAGEKCVDPCHTTVGGYTPGQRTDYNPHTAETVAEAYAAGRNGVGAYWHPARSVRDATTSWMTARNMHEHTSYFGAYNVRKSAAYFLGLRRFWRSGDGTRLYYGL